MHIPKESINYLLVCVIGIAMFLAVGFYPLRSSLNHIEKEIEKIERKIKEKKTIIPLYNEFQKEFSRYKPFQSIVSIEDRGVDTPSDLKSHLREMAKGSNLKILSFIPQIKREKGVEKINLKVLLAGRFPDFGRFLHSISFYPFIERISSFEIRKKDSITQFNLVMEIAFKNKR